MIIQVAVGIVLNSKSEVLIALRSQGKEQGGLWEFPGGKIELGETVEQALKRELFEEVCITALSMLPFIKVEYQYPEKKVLLNVCLVNQFKGQAYGKEGQLVQWVSLSDIENYVFPDANKKIIEKLQGYIF